MMNKQTIKENLLSNPSPPFLITGRIIKKEPKKVYDKRNPFYQQSYFKLQVMDEKNHSKNIFVYPNLVQFQVFKELTNQVHINKWTQFFCERMGKRLILRDWKEIV